MENTVMNNEVVETVVENAPELPAIVIDDISKSNIVESVKDLAKYASGSIKILDMNDNGTRDMVDDLYDEVGNLNGIVTNLHKEIKTLKVGVGAGLLLGGIAAVGFGLSMLKKKKKDIPAAEPVVLQEDVVEGEVVEETKA